MTNIPAAVQRVIDQQEIRDALMRYCRAIDRMDRDLIASVYHPDATDSHAGSYDGPVDGFIDHCMKALPRYLWTLHNLGTVIIEVEGDVAYAESYAICYHGLPATEDNERMVTTGVRYVDRFERRNKGPWLIARRSVVLEWRRDELIQNSRRWKPEVTRGRRDKTDVAYQRL